MSASREPSPAGELLDPAHWDRRGRGGQIEFYATDGEVGEFLRGLPAEFAPYHAICDRWVPIDAGRHELRPMEVPLRDCAASVESFLARRISRVWLRSAAISPQIPLDTTNPPHWCSINGLISIQFNSPSWGPRGSTHAGMIFGAVNEFTGEEREFREQRKLFERLRRRIRKALTHRVARLRRDGSLWESKAPMMTAAAAKLADAGYFDVQAVAVD